MAKRTVPMRRIDPQRLSDVISLAVEAGRIRSQSELANLCDMKAQSLSHIIAGRRGGSIDTQRLLAQHLGVSVRTITTIDPSVEEQATTRAKSASVATKTKAAA